MPDSHIPCAICSHARRDEINTALLARVGVREVARHGIIRETKQPDVFASAQQHAADELRAGNNRRGDSRRVTGDHAGIASLMLRSVAYRAAMAS